jgi:hypothetical protein
MTIWDQSTGDVVPNDLLSGPSLRPTRRRLEDAELPDVDAAVARWARDQHALLGNLIWRLLEDRSWEIS